MSRSGLARPKGKVKRITGYAFLLLLLFLGSAFLILDFPLLFASPRSSNEVVFKSEYNDISRDMAIDSQGNIIIVGGRMDIQEPSISRFHAVKVSPAAEEIWTKTWNVSRSDMIVSVAVDSNDNIILAGLIGFNQDDVTGLIIKLSPDGVILWQTEITGLQYIWHWWPYYSDYFGIEVDSVTDDIYAVASMKEGGFRTIYIALNASGIELWRGEWVGPSDSNGTVATAFWLSSLEGLVIAGRVYGGDDPYHPYVGSFIVGIDFNGTCKWNHTMYSPYWSGTESGANEFVTSTDSWRGYNQVTRYTYDFELLSSFDLIVGERYSIAIDGFCLNGTENIVGYGRVISLIAGKSVTREFTPSFQGPQAPQTLILSSTPSGEYEWFDFLVIGRMSEPCGAVFNSENQLIIAGHTSDWSFYENNFFIVFGFRKTPFYPPYQIALLGFFPIFNIVTVALFYEITALVKKGKSILGIHSHDWNLRLAIKKLLQIQVALFFLLHIFLVGFATGGGPPPLLIYLPGWVGILYWSLPVGILTLGILYLREKWREKNESDSIQANQI